MRDFPFAMPGYLFLVDRVRSAFSPDNIARIASACHRWRATTAITPHGVGKKRRGGSDFPHAPSGFWSVADA